MGCRRVPVVTLPALGLVSKGTEGTRLQAQVLPLLAPAHQYESEHSMWVSSILNVAKPGRGHVLGEVGMVSGTRRRARCAAPARLAHFPSQLRGGRDRAAVPRLPKGHIQIHIRRGALITASEVGAPRLLGKGKSYREQGSSRQSHRGKRVLQNHPLRLRQLLPLPKPPPRGSSLKNTNKNHTTTTTTTTQPCQPLTPFILQYTGII